jgi:hypothetical protein
MAAQAKISARRLRTRIGRTVDVLVDAIADGRAIARSAADAPEIDGVVTIEDGGNLAAGSFARVKITGSTEHDLTARLVAYQAASAPVTLSPSGLSLPRRDGALASSLVTSAERSG